MYSKELIPSETDEQHLLFQLFDMMEFDVASILNLQKNGNKDYQIVEDCLCEELIQLLQCLHHLWLVHPVFHLHFINAIDFISAIIVCNKPTVFHFSTNFDLGTAIISFCFGYASSCILY